MICKIHSNMNYSINCLTTVNNFKVESQLLKIIFYFGTFLEYVKVIVVLQNLLFSCSGEEREMKTPDVEDAKK